MKLLLHMLTLSVANPAVIQMILIIGTMLLLFQMAVNTFSSRLKTCKVNNTVSEFENDMWAIE